MASYAAVVSGKRILCLTGDAVEAQEQFSPIACLQTVGHTVTTVSPGKSAGDTIFTVVHDFEGGQTYTEKAGYNFELTGDFDSVDPSTFAALLIPGGRMCEHIRLNARVIEIVQHFVDAGKPIASICHGIQVLAAVPGALEGKSVSCYPACAPDVANAGGTFVELAMDQATTDGNLVTAPAWPAIGRWCGELCKLLGTRVTHVEE